MNAPTPQLIDQFRAGDRAAYDELFIRYQSALLRYIRAHTDPLLQRHVGTEDLLQETHVEALASLDHFVYRRELSLFFWLCRIASRRIARHYRTLSRKPPALSARVAASLHASSQDLLATLRSESPGPEQRVIQREHLELIATALDLLPDDYREAILLRRIEGLDNATAAERLGISPNALSIRLSRGLVQLAVALDRLLPTQDASPST